MYRKFIALIIASAIAVTGLTAAPARADEDAARVIAGLAALALLGAALRDRDDDAGGHVARPHRPPAVAGPMPYRPEPWRGYRDRALPGHCLREVRSGRGQTARFLGKHCVEQHYRQAHALPRACLERTWTRSRIRSGYDLGCLRTRGYRLRRH